MLRMEVALFIILGFVACVYFSAGRKNTPLHRTFSVLLIAALVHLALDGATVYTVKAGSTALIVGIGSDATVSSIEFAVISD